MMKKRLLLWAVAACTCAISAEAQNVANAVASESGFHNPVIPGYYPDPSVCCVGDDFYMVNSTFQYFPGVPVWHSKDLIHWEQIGNVLSRASQVDLSVGGASSGIFAPTIRYHDGKYYMITTNINKLMKRESGNFIVTADNPAGPWSDPVFIEGAGGIDPSLYWEDGHMYLCWSAMNFIAFAELDPVTYQMKGTYRNIWDGNGDSSPEGPHIYKKDGYYYLLIAEGGTEMGHKVNIARSKNIEGPYTSCPTNPILTQKRLESANSLIQGAGHPDLVQAPDGSWWIVYLAFRTSAGKQLHTLGRETCLAPVRWDKGAWPVVNATGYVDVEMNVPTLPQVLMNQPASKTLFTKGQKLGFEWLYINNPVESNYVYAKNQLQLKASSVSIDHPTQTPTFVAKRQSDINCTVTTQLSLADAKAGDRVGLTVYMDPKGHYDLALRSGADGSQELELSYRLGAMKHVEKSVKLNGKKPIQLRVEADNKLYKFSYSTDGKTFSLLGQMDTYFLATETLGGFTGILFGLFAEGEEGTKASACVDWFDYQPGEEYKVGNMYGM